MIYVLMVDDRHKDPQAHLYSDEAAAVAAARSTAEDLHLAVHPEPAADDPWRFLATSPEGDGVWVVRQELIS